MKKTIDKEAILSDMAHANGEGSLILKPYNEETWEEYAKCSFAFFPGCRLSSAEPEFVLRTYETILSKQPDTAILLHCCGFTAELADEEVLRDDVFSKITKHWQQLGCPRLITACDACAGMFRENLPDIPVIPLDRFLDDPVVGQIAKLIIDGDQPSSEEKKGNRTELKETLVDLYR